MEMALKESWPRGSLETMERYEGERESERERGRVAPSFQNCEMSFKKTRSNEWPRKERLSTLRERPDASWIFWKLEPKESMRVRKEKAQTRKVRRGSLSLSLSLSRSLSLSLFATRSFRYSEVEISRSFEESLSSMRTFVFFYFLDRFFDSMLSKDDGCGLRTHQRLARLPF